MSEHDRDPQMTGAPAARVLAEACERELQNIDSPKLEVVRDLARDLETRLEVLGRVAAKIDDLGPLAEAAQRCGDLATLASCNAGELDSPRAAAESVELASRAVESLKASLEDPRRDRNPDEEDLISRDARSGYWKVSLAAGQLETG